MKDRIQLIIKQYRKNNGNAKDMEMSRPSIESDERYSRRRIRELQEEAQSAYVVSRNPDLGTHSMMASTSKDKKSYAPSPKGITAKDIIEQCQQNL